VEELFEGDPKVLSAMMSKEISDILNVMEGWDRCRSSLRFGKHYGSQRGFIRKNMSTLSTQ